MLNHTTFDSHHTPASRIGPMWNAGFARVEQPTLDRVLSVSVLEKLLTVVADSPNDKTMRAGGWKRGNDFGWWRNPKFPGVEICNLHSEVHVLVGDINRDDLRSPAQLRSWGIEVWS